MKNSVEKAKSHSIPILLFDGWLNLQMCVKSSFLIGLQSSIQ